MNKTLAIIIGIVIVVSAGWLLISNRNTSNEPKRQEVLEKAPDFNLEDYDGKTVQLTDFGGKPLVINSWAAWCTFCKKELEDFALVQKEFGDDIVIIAINRAEGLETAKKYTDELGVTNDLLFLLDPSDSFYRSIGGFSMPETIFVDKEGFIQEHKRGIMDINEIRQKIQKLLQS